MMSLPNRLALPSPSSPSIAKSASGAVPSEINLSAISRSSCLATAVLPSIFSWKESTVTTVTTVTVGPTLGKWIFGLRIDWLGIHPVEELLKVYVSWAVKNCSFFYGSKGQSCTFHECLKALKAHATPKLPSELVSMTPKSLGTSVAGTPMMSSNLGRVSNRWQHPQQKTTKTSENE